MAESPYFKKTLELHHGGRILHFRVSQDLFSSHQVDVGTKRLLRTLEDASFACGKVLDLGCGYGPIGLALQALDPERVVHMVDRDALALDFCRQNAELNHLRGGEIYASLGYDDVTAADFDLVACNLPAKAGEPVLSHLLGDARRHLRPQGRVAVVVVETLGAAVAQTLEDPAIEVLLRKEWPGHVVFHYRFTGEGESEQPPESALERGVYHRTEISVSSHGLSFPMETAYNLAEFDTLSYNSERLLEALTGLRGRPVDHAIVVNPGQGHVPVGLWKLFRPSRLSLVDRDLLALRYTRRNLLLNGCPQGQIALHHKVGVGRLDGEPAGLIVASLRESEGPAAIAATIDQAAEHLAAAGTMLIAGSSTAATRVVRHLQAGKRFHVKQRKRKGNSLLTIREKN